MFPKSTKTRFPVGLRTKRNTFQSSTHPKSSRILKFILIVLTVLSHNTIYVRTANLCSDSSMSSPIDLVPPIEYKGFDIELKIVNTEVARITKLSDHEYKIAGEFGLAVFNMEPYAF